ncbi:serine-rich adhesin for platelets-like [Argopecten irradians]|uniref:serine-rich adhesin for platelets-like n=1 Tax=Argopecten irradians TaxID=31199 RepID=UPI003717834C
MRFEACFCQLVLILCMTCEIVSTRSSYVLDYNSFRRKTQMKSANVFLTLYQSTLVRCIKECMKYTRCKGITFSASTTKCDLGTTSRPGVYSVSALDTMTSPHGWKKNDFNHIAGGCADHGCSTEEKCVDFTDIALKCQTVECPSFSGMTHSMKTTNGSRSIGMEFSIVCPSRRLPTINKTVCGRDGQWTVFSDVDCLTCSVPLYENHSLVSCYHYPSNEKLTYAEARDVCENLGGKVPRIDSELRDSYFSALKDGLYWIEGSTDSDAHNMEYDDGTLLIYKNYVISNSSMCGKTVTTCVSNITSCEEEEVETTTTTVTTVDPSTERTTTENLYNGSTTTADASTTSTTTADTSTASTTSVITTTVTVVEATECILNITTCEDRIPDCGVVLSSYTNDNQMYIRDKLTEPERAVCQMVIV